MIGPGLPPFSGSLDQVLAMLKAMALSPAYALEVATYKSLLTVSAPLDFVVVDANGGRALVNISPADLPDLSYIADSYGKVVTTDLAKISTGLPVLQLMGMPGRLQNAASGRPFRDVGYEAETYLIDAVTWAGTVSDPNRCQAESVILSACFKMLVRRNEQLGGLVQLIQPTGPVEALGSAPPARSGSTIMGSRVRFECLVLSP